MTLRHALAIAALSAMTLSCAGSPRATAPASSAASSGEPPGLPPAPAGGFDPVVAVAFDGAPPLHAEVARRPDQRARGLMQRRALAPDAGMLFVFPGRVTVGFYMFGTLIPLSIAYVDGDAVVSTAEMVPCRAGDGADCTVYEATGPYDRAVEAPAGFFPEHGVRAGTRMHVTGAVAPAT
ncbi:MAG: DUF192 domain-containing protein [Mycobacteriales bacterium]|nr:DUF192 domain-containing protein [Frankia sp.]